MRASSGRSVRHPGRAPHARGGAFKGEGIEELPRSEEAAVDVAQGAATEGSITLATARVGLGAEIPLTGRLGLRVTPIALSYSPAPTEAREDISHVLTLGGALGVAYGF